MKDRPAPWEHLAAAGVMIVSALIMTWPLIRHPARSAADAADVLLNSWILSWNVHQLTHQPWNIYQANIFFPQTHTLAYSENLLALTPLAALGRLFGAGPLLIHNLIFLLSFVLTGWAGWWWIRRISSSWWGGLMAGLVLAFCPFKMGHPAQLHLQAAWWMPLMLLALGLYLEDRRPKFLLWLAVCLIGQWLSCMQYGLYMSLALACCLVLGFLGRAEWRNWASVRHLTLIGGAGFILLVALLWPYFELRGEGFERPELEVRLYSAGPKDFLLLPPHSWLGKVVPQPTPWRERALYPGLIASALAAYALWVAWRAGPKRRRRRWLFGAWLLSGLMTAHGLLVIVYEKKIFWRSFWANREPVIALLPFLGLSLILLWVGRRRLKEAFIAGPWGIWPGWCLGLILLGAFLSLGPMLALHGKEICPGPFFLLQYLPGFSGVRVPARFGILVMLGLSGLAGLGAAQLARRASLWPLLALVGLAILFEGIVLPWPGQPVAPPGQGIYQDLLKQPPAPVVVLPSPTPESDARAVFDSTAHFYPLINGYSGYSPPGYNEMRKAWAAFPWEPVLGMLKSRGVVYVIYNGPRPEAPGLELIASRERQHLLRFK